MSPRPRRHGTEWSYRMGCDCHLCKSAHAKNMRKYRKRRRQRERQVPAEEKL